MSQTQKTLTATQEAFLRICQAYGWQPHRDSVNPHIPAHIATRAAEALMGELTRRLDAMTHIAEHALELKPPEPFTITMAKVPR
jgi:hypothetical protein